MEIAERIDYLVKELCHGNGKEFAATAGLNYTSLSKWRHKERKPTYAGLEKILAAYPEVRREWLVDGKGKPFLGERIAPKTAEKRIVERLEALEKKLDDLLAMMSKFR